MLKSLLQCHPINSLLNNNDKKVRLAIIIYMRKKVLAEYEDVLKKAYPWNVGENISECGPEELSLLTGIFHADDI